MSLSIDITIGNALFNPSLSPVELISVWIVTIPSVLNKLLFQGHANGYLIGIFSKYERPCFGRGEPQRTAFGRAKQCAKCYAQ